MLSTCKYLATGVRLTKNGSFRIPRESVLENLGSRSSLKQIIATSLLVE